jgi:hypothetical protein
LNLGTYSLCLASVFVGIWRSLVRPRSGVGTYHVWWAVALVTSMIAVAYTGAPSAGAAGAPSQSSIEQTLRAATGPPGAQVLAQSQTLSEQLGIVLDNESFTTKNIGAAVDRLRSDIAELAKLITAASYVAGFGFALGAIAKFKAHKDNPDRVSISLPIVLLFIAAALIFIPGVFVYGQTHTPVDPRASPSPISAGELVVMAAPLVREAKAAGLTKESARGALLLPGATREMRTVLQEHGLTGDTLDAVTRLGVLSAQALVAAVRA